MFSLNINLHNLFNVILISGDIVCGHHTIIKLSMFVEEVLLNKGINLRD